MRVGNKKLYKKAHQSVTIELFRAIAERKGEIYGKPNNLAHTKWVCKYHIVFTQKYRRKVIYTA